MRFFNNHEIIFDDIKFIVNNENWNNRWFNYVIINKKKFDINYLLKT